MTANNEKGKTIKNTRLTCRICGFALHCKVDLYGGKKGKKKVRKRKESRKEGGKEIRKKEEREKESKSKRERDTHRL